jgi:hypothetical protein
MFSHSENSRIGRVGPRLAVVFGFACMFAFPAIPIGRRLAIDATILLTAAWVFLYPRIIFGPSLPFIVLVMLPLVQSILATWISGSAIDPAMMPKSVVAYFLSVIPMVAAYELIRAGRLREVLIGVLFALPVHATIAVYQIITFDQGTLPLLGLMDTNPGMAMSSETAALYAEFTRRPFGLFAEPSAMAACVGPWLVLFAGLVTDKDRWPALRMPRGILALGLMAGCFLLAVSQSGQTALVLAGMVMALSATAVRREKASTARSHSLRGVAVLLAAIVATAIGVSNIFGELGMEARTESSWSARLNSLTFVSNALLHDVWTFLFGVGPGQSFPMIEHGARFARNLPPNVSSIWSLTGSYVAETGLFGLLCIGAIAFVAAVSIWESAERTLGIACAVVWLTGIVFATSYSQQPAIWFFLAVLLNWSKQLGFREAVAVSGKSAGVFATR